LRFVVSASPEVFTFAHSRRQWAPLWRSTWKFTYMWFC
jgi:hypothetical protein